MAILSGIDSVGFYDQNARRVQMWDKRFYFSPAMNKYYPNLTMIIHDGGPVAPSLLKWLKEQGHNADRILQEAGEHGTVVHDMIDRNIKGEPVNWVDENGKFTCTRLAWEEFLKFTEFRDRYQPFVCANELVLISNFLRVGMTIDLVCEINGENWIIDFKTSNYIHKDHFIQVAAAAYGWNEYFPERPIHRVGLLHLKAQTRGIDKRGKTLQGKGWQVVEPPKHFKHYIPSYFRRLAEWEEENPDYKPSNFELPTFVNGYTRNEKGLYGVTKDVNNNQSNEPTNPEAEAGLDALRKS